MTEKQNNETHSDFSRGDVEHARSSVSPEYQSSADDTLKNHNLLTTIGEALYKRVMFRMSASNIGMASLGAGFAATSVFLGIYFGNNILDELRDISDEFQNKNTEQVVSAPTSEATPEATPTPPPGAEPDLETKILYHLPGFVGDDGQPRLFSIEKNGQDYFNDTVSDSDAAFLAIGQLRTYLNEAEKVSPLLGESLRDFYQSIFNSVSDIDIKFNEYLNDGMLSKIEAEDLKKDLGKLVNLVDDTKSRIDFEVSDVPNAIEDVILLYNTSEAAGLTTDQVSKSYHASLDKFRDIVYFIKLPQHEVSLKDTDNEIVPFFERASGIFGPSGSIQVITPERLGTIGTFVDEFETTARKFIPDLQLSDYGASNYNSPDIE